MKRFPSSRCASATKIVCPLELIIETQPKLHLPFTETIRMRSSDIIQLYNIVGIGAAVTIVNASLVSAIPGMASGHSIGPENTAPFVMR